MRRITKQEIVESGCNIGGYVFDLFFRWAERMLPSSPDQPTALEEPQQQQLAIEGSDDDDSTLSSEEHHNNLAAVDGEDDVRVFTAEACEIIGCGETKLRALRDNDKVDCKMDGGRPRYSVASLLAYKRNPQQE